MSLSRDIATNEQKNDPTPESQNKNPRSLPSDHTIQIIHNS